MSQREVTPIVREDLGAEPDSLIFDLNGNISDSDDDNIPLNQLMAMAEPEDNFEQMLRSTSVSPVASARSGSSRSARPASMVDVDPENEEGSFSDSEEIGIPVLAARPSHSWETPKRSFEWFKRIADSELSETDLDSFMKDFIPSNDIIAHFEPPKLPNAIWNRIKSQNYSSDEFLKQRSIMKSQKFQTNAIMPLLSVLESLKPSDPNQKLVASAIQMLCSSNLQLTRYRRTSVAKFVKNELRQPLFSQPVTHLHMFGADENESAEKVIKTQATSFSKVLNNPATARPRTFKSNHSSSHNAFHSPADISPHSSHAPAGSSRNYAQTYPKPSTSRSTMQPQQALTGSKNWHQSNSQQPFRASYRGRGRSSRYRGFRRAGTHQ